MRDTFAAEIEIMMKEDPRILLLTGDLGFGVFDSIRENFPKNFINIGVAEQNMTGIASGLAMEGYKVFTYSIANFSTLRCIEQIRNDAAYHNLNVNVVSVGAGFSYGPLGMSHHATEDIAILRSIPNVTIESPSTLSEARFATRALAQIDGVGYLRIDKSYLEEDEFSNPESFSIGKNRVLREGDDLSLFVTGGIAEEAMKAADRLGKNGYQARVISCHTIKPLDKESIIDAINETSGIITIEEHNILGGLGGAIAEICIENSVRPKFFKRIGLKDTFSSVVGSQHHLRKKYKMDSNTIIEIATECMKGS
jgi:transketolase